MAAVSDWDFELDTHPPYSLVMVPPEYRLPLNLKKKLHLAGKM